MKARARTTKVRVIHDVNLFLFMLAGDEPTGKPYFILLSQLKQSVLFPVETAESVADAFHLSPFFPVVQKEEPQKFIATQSI